MDDVLFGGRFVSAEPIDKGWSGDKKYCVTQADGTRYLLRISPIERYEHRKMMFEMQQKVAALGVPMCEPIEFGTCDVGVYSIQSWIDGEEVSWVNGNQQVSMLPSLSEMRQYELGVISGKILQKIHSIPAPETQEDWALFFNRKTDVKIAKYHACGIRFEGDEYVLAYLERNRHLLEGRPQCFHHGDYHTGNMMIQHGELKIIDFDRCRFGDLWDEFNCIVWCARSSPYFASGQLRGYFDGEPPPDFFKLLAFYIASNTVGYITWAIPFGQGQVDTIIKQSQEVLAWFDNMQNPIPSWYLKPPRNT